LTGSFRSPGGPTGAGQARRPGRRPDAVLGDRGYDPTSTAVSS